MPYTCLYSVHPYWWKRQVSHQTWPSGSQHASKKEFRQDIHSRFETHEEGHTNSKTGAISGSTKWTSVQTKNFKKNKQTYCTSKPHKSEFLKMKNSPVTGWGGLSNVWKCQVVKKMSKMCPITHMPHHPCLPSRSMHYYAHMPITHVHHCPGQCDALVM